MLDNFVSCLYCRQLKQEGIIALCVAFPRGIPIAVVSGEVIHDKILEGQIGTTVFEPIEETNA